MGPYKDCLTIQSRDHNVKKKASQTYTPSRGWNHHQFKRYVKVRQCMNVAWMKMAFLPSPYFIFCALQTLSFKCASNYFTGISITNADKMRHFVIILKL